MMVLTAAFAFGWHVNQKKAVSVTGEYPETPAGLSERRKRMGYSLAFAVLAFLPMFLVNAFMSYVGNDYQNYYSYYQKIVSGGEQDVEFTYKLICRMVDSLGIGFQGVYVVYCLISYILLILCIKKYSANYAVSYVLFFLNAYFAYLGLNQIRQFVSVMLIFYAFEYVENKKLLRYVIFVLLAASFHVTAIVMLPFYWILNVKWKLSVYCVAALVLAPVNLFYSEVMTWIYQNFMPRYLNTNYATRELGWNIRYVAVMVITLLITLIYEKKSEKDTTIFRNCMMISNLMVLFSSWLPEYQRFVFYFFVPSIVYIPQLVERDENRIRRICVYALIAAVYLWYFLGVYKGMGIVPYKSIFS